MEQGAVIKDQWLMLLSITVILIFIRSHATLLHRFVNMHVHQYILTRCIRNNLSCFYLSILFCSHKTGFSYADGSQKVYLHMYLSWLNDCTDLNTDSVL